MSKYRPYKDERHEAFVLSMEEYFDGWETVYKFPNNYGASVVQNSGSDGSGADCFEVGYLFWFNSISHLVRSSEFGDSVSSGLTEGEVDAVLTRSQEGTFDNGQQCK